MRFILSIATALGLGVSSADAANFWVSSSNTSSAPPANASQIPVLPPSGTVHVWGRPDAEETLLNWNLTMHTSNPEVINFTAVNVPNPLLGVLMLPGPDKDIKRYEFPAATGIAGDGQSILMKAFTVASTDAVGVGIGPDTDGVGGDPAKDPLYFPATDSWLIAEIEYTSAGIGSTDLFLQIGQSGLNHLFESSAETNVIFGALTDPALNGETDRVQDSATPEAHIVVPEPATVLLGTLGMVWLLYYGFQGRRRDWGIG